MGRQPAKNYPWNKGNDDYEVNDTFSRCSFGSLSRSTSEDDSSAPYSPRAADPEDLEAQLQFEAKQSYLVEGADKRQSILWDQATNRHYSRREAVSDPTSPPQIERWRELQAIESRSLSFGSRSIGSWISSSTATSTPPPPALRSSRRLSLPGAFPIAGINSDGYNGEEEKCEEDASIWPSSTIDEPEGELLVEATLVSEKSKDDMEVSSTELVFQAEPVDQKRKLTMKSVCCLVCLLLVIAVFGVAAGTELGRRRYDLESTSEDSTTNPYDFVIGNSTMTFAPTAEFNEAVGFSGSFSPDQVMLVPPMDESSTLAPTPSPSPMMNNYSINDFVMNVLPDKSRASLDDLGSPQFLAYDWLSADPNLNRRSVIQQLQRFALVTLYYSLDGASWENKQNWLSYGVDECLWSSDAPSGLVCSTDQDDNNIGRYEILSINQGNKLKGMIPDEMWLLSTLVSIQLYGHELHGTLSTKIGKMPYLETLLLFDLSLEGSLPKELGMTQLKSLHLGGNSLTGELPSELGDVEELQYLYLNDNQYLNGTVPTELGRLTHMHELALQDNLLTGNLPSELGRLTNLQMVHLASNRFTGTIPDQFDGLVNAQALVLQSNLLTGSIPNLSGLTQLEYAFFSLNSLTGTIPKDSIGAWSSLKVLDMGSNVLSGTIPGTIGQLKDLLVLDLYNNSLTGTIPEGLGKLKQLEKVMLENNSFNGTIPGSLGSLPKLKRLWLHDNEGLTGSVPLSICRLVQTGSLESLSVDCHRVACDCNCDCSMSSSQGDNLEDSTTKQGGNSFWDDVVEFMTNLFD